MKYICTIILCSFLMSCYYSDGCVFTPQMVNCYYRNVYPDLIRFSKEDGVTNKEKRINDVLECGGVIDNGWIIKNLPKTPGDYYNLTERNKFMDCMKNKGYLFIDEYSCWKNDICE